MVSVQGGSEGSGLALRLAGGVGWVPLQAQYDQGSFLSSVDASDLGASCFLQYLDYKSVIRMVLDT